jgi:hypothetical protein
VDVTVMVATFNMEFHEDPISKCKRGTDILLAGTACSMQLQLQPSSQMAKQLTNQPTN